MSVIVRSPVTAISPPVPTSFADSFNRASGFVGQDWFNGTRPTTPVVDPVNSCGFAIGAGGGGQCLLISTVGNNNPNTFWSAFMACAVTRRSTFAKPIMFVQATFIQDTGPVSNMGPYCLGNDSSFDFYYLDVNQINVGEIVRVNQGAGTSLGFVNGAVPLAANTVIRMSFDGSVGGTSTIRVSLNGVLDTAVNDNAGGRLTTGYTGGFLVRGMNQSGGVTSQQQWRNFSCGLGL